MEEQQTRETEKQPEEGLTANEYNDAIFVQNASNLSGVVNTFNRTIIPKIWVEARKEGHGTKWVNEHPICKLFIHQMAWLTDGKTLLSDEEWNRCMALCREKTGKKEE